MTVHFVGAGPGAADLITVRAQRLLSECAVCLYAGSLVPAEVLAHCPPSARLIDTADLTLDEIIAAMAEADAAGLDVVRLCSGDPAVFSAIAEQARRLDQAGIAYDITPGVPAFAAAAAALRRELTVPGVGQTVILTRIAHRATPMPPREDLASLGATGATLVLHLAVQRIEQVVAELTPHYGRDCPAAVVAYASRDDEILLRGTLGDIAAQVLAAGVRRTAVIIVGAVLAAEGFRDSHLYSAARERGARALPDLPAAQLADQDRLAPDTLRGRVSHFNIKGLNPFLRPAVRITFSSMKWPWSRGTDSESGGPEAVLEQIVHDCLERQEPSARVDATELRANIDERLRNQSPTFLSWVQESRDRLDSAQAEADRQASRTEFAGWAIAGALAVYLALALGRPGSGAGLDAEILGGLAVVLVGRLAWRLRLFARGERKISDARARWEKVLEEAIALPLIAQETNVLLGDDVADTMDLNVATLTGNGRDPEVPVISAAMKNVAATARTIGSGSIGISGPRGAGKSTVLNKFDTRDAAWKSEQDIRVTVAAPVDYDAREFIIHLFTELCTRVAAEAPPQDRIARRTQRHLEDLRFQRTYSSSWGPTLMPASFLSLAWSRGKQRAEQPAGLPALVAQFRAYSQQVAEWNWDRNRDRSQGSSEARGRGPEGVGRVIICIDEMDKIRDSARAEQFLNNIKAIFDVPGCLYLVAISEDAMTVFASQTPAIRTAFDSAFDEIVSVPPMKFPDARRLLQLRTTGVPLPFLALCHVLAGGVPRELIRAARALMQEAEPPKHEELRAVTPDGDPPPRPKVALGVVCEKLIRSRCEVMRREAILQLSRIGAGGDILTPLHQPHWPGDPAGRLTFDALEEAAADLNGAAAAPDNAKWATMCQDAAVALSFYATVTRLFGGNAPLVVQAPASGSDPRIGDRLIDELAIARHAMRTNSKLAAELLAQLPVPDIPGASSGAR